jgi:ABC-2 type transport system permease protein
MRWLRLVRAELRKLTTTKLPWGFVAVLAAISAITAIAVIYGTDADGTKGFIATNEDQRSLLAFGFNAMMGAGLFGAIAVAREYGHGTVVPTFLASPRRSRAMLAQFTAILLAGALLGVAGAALTLGAGAIAMSIADQAFLLSAGDIARISAASALAAALGAVMGAGIGAVVRNTGGAVTAWVVVMFIVPPIVVQLASGAGSWVPNAVVNVISGVAESPSLVGSFLALAAWSLIPAAIGLIMVQRRDVV